MFDVQTGELSGNGQETPGFCQVATLTIGIPTYQRPLCLQARLRQLMPQLNSSTVLVIQDNASPDDYDTVIAEARIRTNHDRIQYRRNPANLGAVGNILKLIENCDTEWLWFLGDDDITADDAVEKVLAAIRSEPQAHYIEFSSEWGAYPEKCVTFGAAGLVKSAATFGNLLFISNGVYRVRPLKEHLQVGYDYASTMAPHVALLMASLASDDMVVLRPERLTIESEETPQWAHLDLYLRLPLLGDVLGDGPAAKPFRAMISRGFPLSELFFRLWAASDSRVCPSRRAAWFVRAATRDLSAITRPLGFVEFLAETSGLRWPKAVGRPLVKMLMRLRGMDSVWKSRLKRALRI